MEGGRPPKSHGTPLPRRRTLLTKPTGLYLLRPVLYSLRYLLWMHLRAGRNTRPPARAFSLRFDREAGRTLRGVLGAPPAGGERSGDTPLARPHRPWLPPGRARRDHFLGHPKTRAAGPSIHYPG